MRARAAIAVAGMVAGMIVILVPALARPALAQDKPAPRPSEADIFGAPPAPAPEPAKPPPPAPAEPEPGAPPAETATPTPAPAGDPKPSPFNNPADPARPEPAPAARAPASPSTPESNRDDAIMGEGATSKTTEDAAPEDPLKVGGMFYLRTQSQAQQGQAPADWALSAPALLDVFLDARPNERVRGMVLGRMFFDPTKPRSGGAAVADPSMSSQMVPGLGGSGAQGSRGPDVVLDQLWLRFDILHTVFVTAGKQHARWGTGRFWSPTDFLHVQYRDALDVFDARSGTTMLKLHLPWEAHGWNFYAYGLLEDVGATATVGDVAGAARAEIVFGTTEVGLGGLLRRDRKPKLAFDASTGIWDLDLYGELALRYGSEIDRVEFVESATPRTALEAASRPTFLEDMYPRYRESGVKPQAVAGLSYSRRYNDNDTWTLGAEYFYNALGYDDPGVYPGFFVPRPTPLSERPSFFYWGRQYGALFLLVPAPYRWDYTTFVLSTLVNFSDGSLVTRLNYSLQLLTHLRFEAYVSVNLGDREGEFRGGVSPRTIAGQSFSRDPALLDLGLALRVGI